MSIPLEISGLIKEIKDTVFLGSENQYQSRIIWITETKADWPQTYQLEAKSNLCGILDTYNVGDMVTCKCNLHGRYWEKDTRNGVMNTIGLWQIFKNNGSYESYKAPQQQPQQYTPPPTQQNGGQQDDLPF